MSQSLRNASWAYKGLSNRRNAFGLMRRIYGLESTGVEIKARFRIER